MKSMTSKEAYSAMFYFLEQLYKRTGSDELGGLLGGMALLADGSPADPAVSRDWQNAVEYATKGGRSGALELER